MKRGRAGYFRLWALLAVVFVLLAVLSAFSPVEIGGYTLRDSGLSVVLKPQPEEPLEACIIDDTPSVPQSAAAVATDSSSKTILFIGDSMLDGLYPRLAAYATHNGHKLYVVIWYSSTSERWGSSDKLSHYIRRINPDFLFVCLGANELFVKDIEVKRGKYLKKLIADIGDKPYVWIGPPNWKTDTGINRLIASHTAPGTFFLSDGLDFERKADGAHPTPRSAAMWMDSVVSWMYACGAHPILLETPPAASGKATRVFIHQPDER